MRGPLESFFFYGGDSALAISTGMVITSKCICGYL